MPLESPITCSDLTATGGVGQVTLSWTNGQDQCLSYLRRLVVEVHAATSNNRASATKVGESGSNLFVHTASRQTRYYWVRVRDVSGRFGAWFPESATGGVSGIASQAATGDIGSGAVGETNLAANAVTASKINVGQLSAITADLGTVNAGTLNAVTINAGRFDGNGRVNIVGGEIGPILYAENTGDGAALSNGIVGVSGVGAAVAGVSNGGGIGIFGTQNGGGGQGVWARAAITNGGTALFVQGTSAITNNIAQITAESTSYNAPALRVDVARSANAAFSYFVGRASGGSDIAVRLSGDGSGYCDGSWTGGGADFAHWLESLDGQPIPVGVTVVLEGERVRPSTEQDDPRAIIGVVRPPEACTVIGNAAWNHWQGKYLRDDCGGYIWEDYTVYRWPVQVQDRVLYRWKRKGVARETMDPAAAPKNARKIITMKTEWRESENATEAPEGAEAVPSRRRKLNPAFDPSVPYTARADRPEWCAVGHAGIVAALKGQPVNPAWRLMGESGATANRWWI